MHQMPEMSNFVYLCSECGMGFASKADLQNHSKVDHTSKIYVCNECGKNFPNATAQESHIEAHTKKLHCCNICNALCKDKLDMYIHVIVSHKHRDVVCDSCLEVFKDKSSLKSHILDVHSDEIPSIANKWEIFCNIHSSQNLCDDMLNDIVKSGFCPDSKKEEDQLSKIEILSSSEITFTDMLNDLLKPSDSSYPDTKLEEDQQCEKEHLHSLENLSSDYMLNDLMNPSDSFYPDPKREEDKPSEEENLNSDKICKKYIDEHNSDDMELLTIVGASSREEKCPFISSPEDNVVKSVGELFDIEGDFYLGKEFDRITKDISVDPDDIYEHVQNLISNSKHFSPKEKDSFTCGACGLVFKDTEDYIVHHICEVPSNIYHLPVNERKVDHEAIEKFSKWRKQAFSYKSQEPVKVNDSKLKKQKENSCTKNQDLILTESDVSLITLISSLNPAGEKKVQEKASPKNKQMEIKAHSKNDKAAEKTHSEVDKPEEKAHSEGGEPEEKAHSEGGEPKEKAHSEGGEPEEKAHSEGGEPEEKARSECGEPEEKARSEGGEPEEKARSEGGEPEEKARSEGGEPEEKARSENVVEGNALTENTVVEKIVFAEDIQRPKNFTPKIIQ